MKFFLNSKRNGMWTGLFCSVAILCFLGTGCDKSNWPLEPSEEQPITFTFYTIESMQDMLFNDPIAKEITRRTGVTLEVNHPRTNSNQDIPLMITSGEYDDLIYAKSDMMKLIDVGAVIALDDWVDEKGKHHNLIDEYCPNMKKLYGDQLVKLKNNDGHIYSFGTYGINELILETSGTFQLQHAVLKELGYPKINTLDEYANAIRAYMKKYPEIDGQKTIGFSLLLDTWQWYIDFSNPANYLIGYGDDGQWLVDKETHEVQYKFFNPEISLYYRWLNELYHDGTLDPESFTQSEDVWRAKVASGCVVGIAYPNWGYRESRAKLIADGKPERTYAYLSITASKDYPDPSLTDYGYSGGWGISISKTCKDVIRACRFMDFMCSEEAQILTNWGIENQNYYIFNGKRRVTQEEQIRIDTMPNYQAVTGVTRWTYPFPECGTGAVDSNGDWLTRNSRQRIIDTYLPVERETLSRYGAQMWIDLFTPQNQLYRPVHGQLWQYQLPSSVITLLNTADDYTRAALTQCVMCPIEEFDAKWNEMVQGLKDMGMVEAGKEVTSIIKTKLQLWGIE